VERGDGVDEADDGEDRRAEDGSAHDRARRVGLDR
jgi:hypothetical protein